MEKSHLHLWPPKTKTMYQMLSNTPSSHNYTKPSLRYQYGLGGEVSMNGDVYSYMIMLLEMMTGRSPIYINCMFNECLNLHNFAKMALPDHVKEIVEPKLLSNDEEEISSTHTYLDLD
ncbi:hypothetical protein LguiB_014242 [Lonicera macranthoides]